MALVQPFSTNNKFYSAPVGERSIAMSMSVYVCLTVCPRGYLKKLQVRTSPNFLCTLPVAAARHAAVAACDTLCTSGFVDDVIFSYNRPYGGMSAASLHDVATPASCTG